MPSTPAGFTGSNRALITLTDAPGPMNPVVPLDAAYVETGAIARRLDSERLRPSQPANCRRRW